MKGGDDTLNTFKSAVAAVSILGMLVSAAPALAQTATPSLGPRRQALCTATASRLNSILGRIEANQGKAQSAYQKLGDYLKQKGSQLQVSNPTAYTTLSGYYQTLVGTYEPKITADFQTYLTDLQSAQTMAQNGQCGTSDGAFRQLIVKIRGDHKQVKSDVLAARSYYQETIKPYVIGLRRGTVSPTPAPTSTP